MAKRKFSNDELTDLPADIRREVEGDGAVDTVAPPSFSKPTPAPLKGRRDETLVEVLVIAHNMPVGIVVDDVLSEDGEPEFDDQGNQKTRIAERPLKKKERKMMPRWCAEIMARNDHLVILSEGTAR